jgi:hypothetical protein
MTRQTQLCGELYPGFSIYLGCSALAIVKTMTICDVLISELVLPSLAVRQPLFSTLIQCVTR